MYANFKRKNMVKLQALPVIFTLSLPAVPMPRTNHPDKRKLSNSLGRKILTG